jgi:cyclase
MSVSRNRRAAVALAAGLTTTVLIGAATTAAAQEFSQEAERERIVAAFGWDFAAAEVTTQQINDKLYVLFGIGGNVLVSRGEDGVLLVDDQFPQMAPKLQGAIGAVGGGTPDFIINTHWHFDHADGNLAFGPQGSWLISQANSREKMLGTHVIDLVTLQYTQGPYPRQALPVIAFERNMQLHFNGERIDLLHFGPAHTTGDTAVVFRGSNVLHMGDVFNNAGYPFVDTGNGGSLDGLIAFCRAVLGEIDSSTVIVPGHGPVTSYDNMQSYVAMLQVVRDRISGLIADGADLEAVMAAKPTEGFDEKYGDPAMFINRAYFSLAGEGASAGR